MKRIIVFALACLVLAGCSQGVWTKPGSTQADFDQDRAACQYDADKAAAPAMATNGFLSGYQSATLAKECMQARGYTLSSKANIQSGPKLAAVRAPGQTLDQLHALEKACAAAATSQSDTVACLKRNRVTVIPATEFSKYVQKAVASGAVKQQNLKNGMPDNEADRLAVDKLVWADFDIR